MADEINPDLLREQGVTCAKLKSFENRERRDKKMDFKQAQEYRKLGLLSSAQTKEGVGNVQDQLANKLMNARKRFCALK